MIKAFQFFFLAFTSMVGSVGCQHAPTPVADRQPNILLIVTDDMGYGDVGISGNPTVRTPRLDQLARESVQFKNFYVSPVCAPTRASLLTGRYHQRTGVRSVTNGFETMDPEEVTLAETLDRNGYRTGIFGKWHLGEYFPSVPNEQGFNEYLGFRTGHTNHYYDAKIEHNGKQVTTKGHITDVLTESALDFMTASREEPFFCYLAYNAPHTPLQVDSSWWSAYADEGLEEREARIYGMIAQIDQGIGVILDQLDKTGQLDNTILIFMSDNGPISGWRLPQEQMRYNAGLRDQKFTIYEGGIRTQCYWKWGDYWEPKVSHQVAAHIDVLPTILDLISLSAPESVDGISLKPVLDTNENMERMFFQKYSLETLVDPAPYPGGMVRKGDWKMVNGEELYNLSNDPGEEVNLAASHPELLEDLHSSYLAWYQDVADDHQLQPIKISIGHQQENPVYLQPHHGKAHGNVKFWGNRGLTGGRKGTHPRGVDSDWTAGWSEAGDAISWETELIRSGDYRFKILVRDSTSKESLEMKLSINQTPVEKAISSTSLNPDWSEIILGVTTLEAGPCSLKLTLDKELDRSLEVRALVVERL